VKASKIAMQELSGQLCYGCALFLQVIFEAALSVVATSLGS